MEIQQLYALQNKAVIGKLHMRRELGVHYGVHSGAVAHMHEIYLACAHSANNTA